MTQPTEIKRRGDLILIPTCGHRLNDHWEVNANDLTPTTRPPLPNRYAPRQAASDSFNWNAEPCSYNDLIYNWLLTAAHPTIAERKASSGRYQHAYLIDAARHDPTRPIKKSTIGDGIIWLGSYYDASGPPTNPATTRGIALGRIATATAWQHAYPDQARELTELNLTRNNEALDRYIKHSQNLYPTNPTANDE